VGPEQLPEQLTDLATAPPCPTDALNRRRPGVWPPGGHPEGSPFPREEGVPGTGVGAARVFKWGLRGHDMDADFGHPPSGVLPVDDTKMHNLLAVIGVLKRAWEYQLLLRRFRDSGSGNYILTAETAAGVIDPALIADMLQLSGADLRNVSFTQLKTLLGLDTDFPSATDDDAAAVLLCLLRRVHIFGLMNNIIVNHCK
jgi:hypothetical protein